MKQNAAILLEEYKSKSQEMSQDWEKTFKLKNDPRITRVGKLLRKTSLDELPQIWNVIRREMSLVGPRPITPDEQALYGDGFKIYQQVLPGMTGLWQISGRSDLPYEQRVKLDIYYVQNWSYWFDFHILLHTILVVLRGKGAY